jgi:hypothetical protein
MSFRVLLADIIGGSGGTGGVGGDAVIIKQESTSFKTWVGDENTKGI